MQAGPSQRPTPQSLDGRPRGGTRDVPDVPFQFGAPPVETRLSLRITARLFA
jgi:hypothetical protein